MRLLGISRRPRKPTAVGPRRSPTTLPANEMALAGAVIAMAQNRHSSTVSTENASPETKLVTATEPPQAQSSAAALVEPTCEKLEKTIGMFSNWGKPSTTASNTQANPLHTADRLIGLLSKLPYELRLNIYEYCIPCMWHRKRKILLDYVVDCKWMATSPVIFSEAARLVFSGPTPFVYTRLPEGETLADIFNKHIRRAFADDYSWTSPAARSMIEKMAVTVRCPFHVFYRRCDAKDDFAKCLLDVFASVGDFPNLTTLYISLGPDCFASTTGPNQHFANDWGGEIEEHVLQKLEVLALMLKTVIPKTCKVIWRFDAAAMPHIIGLLAHKSEERLIYLHGIHEAMDRYWRSASDTATMLNTTALAEQR
jgi:hypothetical protein